MSANNNYSAQAALASAIASLTPAQLNSLTTSVAAAGAANPQGIAAGAMVAGGNTPQATNPPIPAVGSISSPGRRNQALRKKPLNGFMTFRTYYSPIFKGLTQKDKSGLLREMWGADLKKPMWTLLGYAYSDLRDHHEEALAVDKFLAATVPLLPIVPADQYLTKMGWELAKNAAGGILLKRDTSFAADKVYADYPERTKLSIPDIVNHCYKERLLRRESRRASPRLRPVHPTQPQVGTNTAPANAPPPSCGGSLVLAVAPQPSTIAATTPTTATTASITGSAAGSEVESGSEAGEIGEEERGELTTEDVLRTPAYLSIQHVTADQQAAFETNALALHFHPSIQPPILGFDPRIIQDDFDPFDLDLSGLVDWEEASETL